MEELSAMQRSPSVNSLLSDQQKNADIEIDILSENSNPLIIQGEAEEGLELQDAAHLLTTQYQQSGNMAVLNEAIRLLRRTILLIPHYHPKYSTALNNLGCAINRRYEQTGDIAELAECISLHRKALVFRPRGHQNRGASLVCLASALIHDYNYSGNIDVLFECISLYREALALFPQDHPHRGISLNNLADVLSKHYEQSGDMDALVECISLNRNALLLRPLGHPQHGSSLNNLANALRIYYEQSGNLDALTECISLHRDALALRPQGHPHRGSSLNNLADALNVCCEQSGDITESEECIDLFCEALLLQPEGNPYRFDTLYSLCKAYIQHFNLIRNEKALQSALKHGNEILSGLPHGHPNRQDAYHLMARIRLKDSSYYSYEEALDYLNQAINYVHALPRHRLRDAIETLRSIEKAFVRHPEQSLRAQQVLELYLSTVELLPLTANYGLTNDVRLRELSESGKLCRPAAIYAINCNQIRLAVQLHEEGKAVFWSQALRLRSSALDSLPNDDREMLRSLFRQLEHDSADFSGELRDRADLERRVEYRRQLNKQAEKLIEDIRRRPGFDRFLKIPLFEQLRLAASSGYVVVLVSNEAACFAVIIHTNDHPSFIPLKAIKSDALNSLCKSISESGMRDYGQELPSSNRDKELTRAMAVAGHRDSSPLAKIWRTIVKPVINSLLIQRSKGRDRPRVHWCPSGDLSQLPLHAAGIYDGKTGGRVCAADYIVSSYTPSLSTLLKAREGYVPIPRHELHAALYADSGGHGGHGVIHKVFEEVQTSACVLISKGAVVDNDVRGCSTTASVLEGAAGAHILHLSCHGLQHRNPLESHFALKNQRLTISDLMALDLNKAVLVYLSACYTARGDEKQPDQAVHLAASMLFCGFRSVVATMWAMYDTDGPKMAEWFYEALLENEVIRLDDIPYALDAAITKLRSEGTPPRQWATYMHLGA